MLSKSIHALGLVSGLLLSSTFLSPGSAVAFDLSVAAGADPTTLDPRKTWVAQGYSINAHVFEPMFFRAEKDGNVVIEPILAESWAQKTPTELEIKLREGIKFQNGEPFNAEAVAYTINSIQDNKFVTNLKLWTREITSVEVTGPYTLLLKTARPTRGLLNVLAQVPIVAPKAAQSPDFEKKPIGTGPYKIVSYVPSGQVVIEKNHNYWGKPGEADKITFRIMPETSTRLAALEANEVQIADNLPPDKLPALKANKNLQVVYTPTLRVDYLVMNFRNPLMQDRKFREALSLAIDRQGIVDNLLGGTTKAANSISPPGTIGYAADLPVYAYDPGKAKALLAESGYKGQVLKIGGPVGRYSMDKQVTEAIAGMLQAIGVNVEVETLAFSSYMAKYNEAAYDLAFIGQTDFTINPQKHWGTLFQSSIDINKYSNPEMDQIIEAASSELDDAKAAELFRKGQSLEHKNFGGALPLYYEPQLIGLGSKVTNFSPRLDEYIIVDTVKLKP